jgi:ATP-dependent DNA helicase RecQ
VGSRPRSGIYGDGGWGSVTARARHGGSTYPDQLVDAAVQVVARWQPGPPPAWVTCVPSGSADARVAEVARRVADALGLPFHEVVARIRPGRPQAEMENSAQQVRNVYGAFDVRGPLPAGAVLLVDDVVDSRWTLTVVGALLRRAGAEAVHPLALARASPS